MERDAEVPKASRAAACLPQQPMVDEDAGQLIADGLVHEYRSDGRVDAAVTQHPLLPTCAQSVRLLLDHRSRRHAGGAAIS
jgi:hypothetical protein